MSSEDEKGVDYPTVKVASSDIGVADVVTGTSIPAPQVTDGLKRQMKNRHIAMIRQVSLHTSSH